MRPFCHGLCALVLATLSCGPSAPGRASSPARAEPSARPDPSPPPRADGRLPPGVRPLGYRLELTVDPREKSFFGRSVVRIEVEQPGFAIVLHGRDIRVLTAAVSSRAGKQWATAKPRLAAGSRGEPEELVLIVERELPKGPAELDIQYEAPFADGLAGLYRVDVDGRKYAYTQFEPMDARRAFPCFDEPSFKVPFELAVTTPDDLTAVANTPLRERKLHHQSGLATHLFEPSPPLPTYLVALAVGQLDVAPGPESPVPIRAVTAQGRSALTTLARDTAHQQLELLADYFGEPYPYAKLDLVAVPDFGAGAMENPGLVTFREELLLLDSRRASAGARRALANVMAHELAHQWFGNSVTLAWWDDLWLNEGFASWMGTKIVERASPALGAAFEALAAKSRVMGLDALESARRVRQPVRSSSEALEAFDGITYVKGMSVLAMVESWLGEDVFRNGVRSYVQRHRHSTARARDLVSALEAASGKPVSQVMDGFLDQTGVPLVRLEQRCDASGARLSIVQSVHRPLGVAGGDEKLWRFPICVRLAGAKDDRVCTLLETRSSELDLGKGCPKLISPNAGELGYYRWLLPERELRALATRQRGALSTAERLGLVGNAWALVRSGALGADVYLELLRGFADEPSRIVWESIASSLDELERTLASEAERAALARYVDALAGRAARRLGWTPRADDGDERRLLRRTLLGLLVRHGDAAWVREGAAEVARSWLSDPLAVDPDVAAVALPSFAKSADAAFVTALFERLKGASTPEQRMIAISGLTGVREPALVRRVLDALLDPALLKAQDVRYVLPPLFWGRETRELAWSWLVAEFDRLRVRLPPFAFGRVAWVTASFCDDARVERAAAFLGPRLAKLEGADKPMRQAVEAGKLCAALARGQREAAMRVLARGKP